jgi:23S rRNA (guanine745-N1)-methyltransferase
MALIEAVVERVAASIAERVEKARGETVDKAVERTPAPPPPGANQVVVDLGCGSGELLAALVATCPVRGIGIDLSTAAAERAAKRTSAITWVVANADRRLPFVDTSARVVVSVHGRRNPAECARILQQGGHLLVAVPAPDDLIELREVVQGVQAPGAERSRLDAVIAEHESLFDVVERFTVRTKHRLDRAALLDILSGTYRGARTSVAANVAALDDLDVTLASDVVVLSPQSQLADDVRLDG